MTEQLKTLMDRAADVDFATVDLDAITGAGDRTVRRRRIATGVAGVAALAVVATGAVLLADDGDGKADFVDNPFVTNVPMWTEGSTLHTPDRTFDLGVDVASFVRTSEGIVFLGWDGNEKQRFGVYSYAGEGEPTRIGSTQDSRLRSDPAEPYVGWLNGVGDDLQAVVYDQSIGERVWSERARQEFSFPIVAIDGTRAYLADADEGPVLVLDLASKGLTELPDNEVWRNFVAVEGELVAHTAYGVADNGDGNALVVGPAGDDRVTIPGGAADGAAFSPDGRWISAFGGDVSVYDTVTGEAVDVDSGRYPNGLGYEWLDADTLLAITGSADGDEIELIQCEIPAGTCELVAPLGGFDDGELFAISFGESIWGVASEGEGSASVEVTEVAPVETSSTEGPE